MKFSWKTTPRPIVCLAPMDGWTDSPFRRIVKEIEPQAIVFTEFVSVDGLTHKKRSENLLQKAIFHTKTEKPLVVQLFGKDPEKFAIAASMLEKMGADAIDINFGCPARKVVNHHNGAALLKTPELAEEIVRATVEATNLEVSVKTRLGWEDKNQIFSFGEMLLKAGAKALTFHGRTAKQAFLGEAAYENIFEFKRLFPESIIIGNGDICTRERAEEILEKLDGVMIGREATRNPFIFREILSGENPSTLEEKISAVLRQAKYAEKYREKYGIIAMRKFFAFICKGFEGASEFRAELMKVENYSQAEEVFAKILKKA